MFDSGNLQNSQFMASGDVNGDKRSDLVIVNSSLPARVVVYLRNAADGFDAGLETAEPYGANSIVLADVGNADGKLDALVTNPVSQSVSVMIGAGNGYFSLIGNVAVGKQAFGLTARMSTEMGTSTSLPQTGPTTRCRSCAGTVSAALCSIRLLRPADQRSPYGDPGRSGIRRMARSSGERHHGPEGRGGRVKQWGWRVPERRFSAMPSESMFGLSLWEISTGTVNLIW